MTRAPTTVGRLGSCFQGTTPRSIGSRTTSLRRECRTCKVSPRITRTTTQVATVAGSGGCRRNGRLNKCRTTLRTVGATSNHGKTFDNSTCKGGNVRNPGIRNLPNRIRKTMNDKPGVPAKFQRGITKVTKAGPTSRTKRLPAGDPLIRGRRTTNASTLRGRTRRARQGMSTPRLGGTRSGLVGSLPRVS